MTKQFKPLLAVQVEDISKLSYPIAMSPKLDGIRAIVIDGKIVSRNLKPIRNKYIQSILGKDCFNGLDGELIVGDPFGPRVFRNTTSGVMSEDGTPDFTFYVFDNYLDNKRGFYDRYKNLTTALDNMPKEITSRIKVLHHSIVSSPAEVDTFERLYLKNGYEGAMLRSIDGVYKFGRSTLKEAIILKLKRFTDYEAKIIGFCEGLHNANIAKIDALGHTERSTHKENMIPNGTLGSLIIEYTHISNQELKDSGALKNDELPSVGSGFSDGLRKDIWDNPGKYLGRLITVKSFDYGDYAIPRFPIFKWFRDENDISV